MALKARVEDQVQGGGFQITADDTVYKLTVGGALRHYEPKPGDKDRDGNPAEPSDAPYIYVEATPVNPKTHKAIAGAESQRQYYRAGWDLEKFVPGNVVEGDLDKLAAKVQTSDKEPVVYRTLTTQKGVDTGFVKGSEAGLFMAAVQQRVDINIDFLDELSGIVCVYTEVDTGKKDKQGKPKMLSVPGKILVGPGGVAIGEAGKAKASAKAEPEEDEDKAEEVPATKAAAKAKAGTVAEEEVVDEPVAAPKAKAKAGAKATAVTAASIATNIANEVIANLVKKGIEFDAARVSKSSKRDTAINDEFEANPDLNDDVLDLLGNLKWIQKLIDAAAE